MKAFLGQQHDNCAPLGSQEKETIHYAPLLLTYNQ